MYYLGLDVGSSSIKAALVEVSTGKSLGVVQQPQKEMGMIAPKTGWAEQKPELWWEHCCDAIKKLKKTYNISKTDIKAIGISYQMHGLVVVDDKGNSLRPSLIWCDSRAVAIGEKAYLEIGEDFCDENLLNSPANFTASKLKWVKENEPKIYNQISKFMLPGDYIAYRFSNKIQTTISGLSEAILWNYKNNNVANCLLEYYGIDKKLIPEIVDTFSIQSKVNKKGAEESGLAIGTPITYRAGDQPNNALALNVFNPGEVAGTGGTSGVFYAISDNLTAKDSARVNNFAHVNFNLKDEPRIGKMACINGAGIQYRWLLNNLKVKDYNEMNELANKVDIGSEGLCMLPFGNGAERIFNNREIGARLVNLNFNLHGQGHMCRAALEGIAFSFVYGMEILKEDGVDIKVIRVGNDNLFRSELFSNTISTLISHPIEVYNTTGAIGAARAAGLHNGDFDKFGKHVLENDHIKTFKPKNDKVPYVTAYSKWKEELQLIINK